MSKLQTAPPRRLYGYLAEFETVNGLIDACAALRALNPQAPACE